MSRSTREWAVRARAAMVEQLGGKCAECGWRPRFGLRRLELDHIKPIYWTPRRLSSCQRIAWYRAAITAGNLQVLCRDCNSKKNVRDEVTA